jgi:hypothetical protein
VAPNNATKLYLFYFALFLRMARHGDKPTERQKVHPDHPTVPDSAPVDITSLPGNAPGDQPTLPGNAPGDQPISPGIMPVEQHKSPGAQEDEELEYDDSPPYDLSDTTRTACFSVFLTFQLKFHGEKMKLLYHRSCKIQSFFKNNEKQQSSGKCHRTKAWVLAQKG